MTKTTDIIESAFSGVGVVFGLVGLLGVLVAVRKGLKDLADRDAKNDAGRVCSHVSMGVFAAQAQDWRRTAIPWLPTLTGLVKAGEALAYTSTMFDQIPNANDEVCWKSLYEAFFTELLWLPSFKGSWGLAYVEKARQHLEATGHNIDRHRLYEQEPYAKHSPALTKVNFRRMEAGLLRFKQKGSPTLVKCIMHLPGSLQYSSNWEAEITRDVRQLWIHDDRPSIAVSRLELASLQFILGMRFTVSQEPSGRPMSLKGSGLFGTALRGAPAGVNDEYFRLRLFHFRYEPWHWPSKGSGYSILLAKTLACGFLPFEEDDAFYRCVGISPSVFQALRLQHNLKDDNQAQKFTLRSYFQRLPSRKQLNVYYGDLNTPCSKTRGPAIYDESGKVAKGYWCEAVARIAFGGLVPMATLPLVQAVRFTASAGVEFGDALSQLHNLLVTAQVNAGVEELFGVDLISLKNELGSFSAPWEVKHELAAVRMSSYMTMLERFVAMVKTPPADLVEKVYEACRDKLVASYLKSCTAENPDRTWENSQGTGGPNPTTTPATQAQAGTVSQLYVDFTSENAGKVSAAHLEAMEFNIAEKVPGPNTSPTTTRPGEKTGIGKELADLNQRLGQKVTINDLGELARLLIVVWTYHVTIIVGNETERDEAKKWFNGREDRIYMPIPLEELPRLSLLG